MRRKSRAKPDNPFKRFNSSSEIIRLVVLMYVRSPLSLWNVEDLLFEGGSHPPLRRRERVMQRFYRMKSLQKFASVHAKVHNRFNSARHLIDRQTYKINRSAALAE